MARHDKFYLSYKKCLIYVATVAKCAFLFIFSSVAYFTSAMEVDTPTNNYQQLRCKRSLNDCQLPTNVS